MVFLGYRLISDRLISDRLISDRLINEPVVMTSVASVITRVVLRISLLLRLLTMSSSCSRTALMRLRFFLACGVIWTRSIALCLSVKAAVCLLRRARTVVGLISWLPILIISSLPMLIGAVPREYGVC